MTIPPPRSADDGFVWFEMDIPTAAPAPRRSDLGPPPRPPLTLPTLRAAPGRTRADPGPQPCSCHRRPRPSDPNHARGAAASAAVPADARTRGVRATVACTAACPAPRFPSTVRRPSARCARTSGPAQTPPPRASRWTTTSRPSPRRPVAETIARPGTRRSATSGRHRRPPHGHRSAGPALSGPRSAAPGLEARPPQARRHGHERPDRAGTGFRRRRARVPG